MKVSDFLEFNTRTKKMKFDKAYFDSLNFNIGKDNKNTVIELVLNEFRLIDDKNKEINYDALGKITDKVLISFLASNIQNIEFFCKIIEENFEFSDNYYDSLISLYKLIYVIDKSGVSLSSKYLCELMERSTVLRENIKNIAANKKEEIERETLNRVIRNDTMLLIVNVYLDMYYYNSFNSDDEKYTLKTANKKEKVIKEPPTRKRKKNTDVFKTVSELLSNCDYSSYVSFVSKFSPLTFEEEIDLCKRISKGDRNARDKLIYHNLVLVLTIVGKYTNSGLELLDLISEGNIGLAKAASKYDYTRGVRFSSVASWWIIQSITRAIDNQSSSIRIPIYKKNQITNYLKAKEKVLNKVSYSISLSELSYYLDMSLEKVNYFESLITNATSLNEILEDEENCELQDLIIDSEDLPLDSIIVENNREEVRRILDSEDINAIEKEVVKRHLGFYGEKQSFSDIGAMLKLSRERIRVIFNTAINKIKKGKNIDKYKEFSCEKMYIKK